MSRSFFPKVEQEDGVAETYLKSWTDFDKVVKKLLRQPTFVYRGQRDSAWLVEPSLTRLVTKRSTWKRNEADYMPRFRLALRGRLDDQLLVSLNDDELLAIGQHFGLATPLLDWSESPYVALFFAFESPAVSESGYRSVYALDGGHVRGVEDEAANEAIVFVRPSSGFNKRLVHQAGLFTKSPPFIDIEAWVAKYFEGVDDAILIKVNIASSDRQNCLRRLNRMNINYSSLFPDIDGAARFCNLKIEIPNY